jgi:hypothetical protein
VAVLLPGLGGEPPRPSRLLRDALAPEIAAETYSMATEASQRLLYESLKKTQRDRIKRIRKEKREWEYRKKLYQEWLRRGLQPTPLGEFRPWTEQPPTEQEIQAKVAACKPYITELTAAVEEAERYVLSPALHLMQEAPILKQIGPDATLADIKGWAEEQARCAKDEMRWKARCGLAWERIVKSSVGRVMRLFGVKTPLDLYGVRNWLRAAKAPDRVAWEVAYERILNPRWWRRAVCREMVPAREKMWRILAPEWIEAVSPDAREESRDRDRANEIWAKNYEAIRMDNPGQVIGMPSPKQHHKRQYAEILATAKGLGDLADAAGMTPWLITVTVPEHMHPTTTAGMAGRVRRANQAWDQSTPRDVMRWLTNRWQRLRSALNRRSIQTYWLRATEPHKDGTPHYHLVMWAEDQHWPEIRRLFRHYFEAGAAASQARQKRGVQVERVMGGTAGAVAYATSYIAKGTDGISGEEGEAERMRAWRRTWNVRAFEFSERKATLWRMLRATDLDPASRGKSAQAAARAGQFAAFLQAVTQGGITLYRETTPGPSIAGYAAPRTRVLGVVDGNGVISLKPRWKVQQKINENNMLETTSVQLSQKNQGKARAALLKRKRAVLPPKVAWLRDRLHQNAAQPESISEKIRRQKGRKKEKAARLRERLRQWEVGRVLQVAAAEAYMWYIDYWVFQLDPPF